MKDWHHGDKKKADLYRDFLYGKLQPEWATVVWFHCISFCLGPQLKGVVVALDNAHTTDVRYTDQLSQMKAYVLDTMNKCRHTLICPLVDPSSVLPCSEYTSRFFCFPTHNLAQKLRHQSSNILPYYNTIHRTEKIGPIYMCHSANMALKDDVWQVLNGLLTTWLSQFYYVCKLYKEGRLSFPIGLTDKYIKPLSLSDVSLWEVVCADDEKEILSHPMLPHPADFLEKKEIKGDTYASKACFQYQIAGTLKCYPVVLTHTPSIIPKLSPSTPKEETAIVHWKQPQIQPLEQGSTSGGHSRTNPKRKRRLSKILKETRKKNKTKWCHKRRAQNEMRSSFPIDAGNDYESDDADADDDSQYHRCEEDYDYYEFEPVLFDYSYY